MPDGGPENPMRAAQLDVRPAPVKRFYKVADVSEEADGRHALTLDGRRRTGAGRNGLAVKSRAVMRGGSRRNGRGRARRWTRPTCR